MFSIQKPKKIEQFWNHYFHCELSFTKQTSVVMMESGILRFPYKLLALRLNRSRSRYKSPTEKAELPPRPFSQGNVTTSDPFYQEITDFPDKSLKEVDCKKSGQYNGITPLFTILLSFISCCIQYCLSLTVV